MAGQSGHGRRSSTRGGARSGAYKGATGTGSTGAEGLREGAGKRAEAAARCTDRRGSGRAVLCRDAFSSEHGVASKLQRNVVASLLALELAPREEFRTPQGYSLDAVVLHAASAR